MANLAVLVPIALVMGIVGLAAFLWSLRHGQYDDLDGAGERILLDDDAENPTSSRPLNLRPRMKGGT